MSGNQRFSITPAVAVEDTTLSDSVFRTLACLGVYGDKNGWCWPSLKTIADMRGVSKERISADIKILVQRGYVQKKERYQDNTQITNMYRILFDTSVTPPLTPEVNPPLTTEINTPLTPEVNQNAPINDLLNDKDEAAKSAEVFTFYQNNIEMLTPYNSQLLGDFIDTYSAHWVMEALEDCAEYNHKNIRYCEAILKGWKANGFRVDNRQKGNYAKQNYRTQRIVTPAPVITDAQRALAAQILAGD